MKKQIYCGNNLYTLNNKGLKLGTRYTCLKKGICKGLNLPIDEDYNGTYKQIIKENIYCGDKINLPKDYTRKCSLSDCLQKGIGIGKSIKSKRKPFGKKEKK